MKTIHPKSKLIGAVLLSVAALTITACSDDKSQPAGSEKSAAKAKAPEKKHVEHGEATDTAKFRFEKEFAQKCTERELRNSNNPDVDKPRLEESCGCIARHMSEDLADTEAEKYLKEHEDTHSLQIKFDAAAYFCLQNKPVPKGPHLFGKP
ncbi:hypothetical protein ACQE3E_23065 [Methylomonas sp. MED-D]|uniref:Lipoprotein n=1 Tax=Methylomonas koyamae TaxID=702114 RepID=A0A177N3T7_9GAMM|nr:MULTISPECIES: hypothetical protein [Methylomonas]MDT4332756.1 hypothetical protein [Methylomonas sp. MV1]NJA08355.1 hypothetical protein [Methylococcaceae bacterium WWC4]OAI12542.1 hypothetical protein A1355_14440 [Methylomonas koyamae]